MLSGVPQKSITAAVVVSLSEMVFDWKSSIMLANASPYVFMNPASAFTSLSRLQISQQPGAAWLSALQNRRPCPGVRRLFRLQDPDGVPVTFLQWDQALQELRRDLL
jgi:hypothetical protein